MRVQQSDIVVVECILYMYFNTGLTNQCLGMHALQCSLPARTLSVHEHAHRDYNRRTAVTKRSSKAQLSLQLFQCHHSQIFTRTSFSIFSIQSGCDKSGWGWSLVLKHSALVSYNSPQAPPCYITPRRWDNTHR